MTATRHLIGRDAELAALAACLDRAAAGQGQVVFLTGDAGIGKSALAQEFLRRAEAAGHRTLTGHAYLAEGQAPYAVVVDAVRDGLRRYRRNDRSGTTVPFGPPAGGVIDGRDDKVWLFESGYEFFGGLVPPKAALIVFLGDLQWADTAALEFVHYLGRNLQSDRILLLVSYRREDLNRRPALAQTLGSLRRQGHTTEITLRPLSPAEAAGLARVLPGLPAEPPPDLVEELHERARGNPLYFIELIRATAETGVPPGPAGGSSAPLPQLIQDVVQSRLEGLTPVSRDSLVVAAAIGLVVPYPVWQRAGSLDEHALLEAIEPLCQIDLLRERAGEPELTFEFTHPLIRDAVYATLSPVRRHHAHGHIVDALIACYGEDDPDHVAELSYHLARTGDRGRQARSVAVFRRAGDRALELFANAEAAAHYRLALDHLPVADLPSAGRLAALEGYGRALRRTGDLAGAVAAWEEARAGWLILGEATRAAALWRRIGLARWQQGDGRAAVTAYQAGLDLLGPDRAAVETADLHQELATAWQSMGDIDRAAGAADAAARLAECLDGGAVAARAQTALLTIAAYRGDREAARDRARRALDRAAAAGARSLTWRPHYLLGWLAVEFGETAEAEVHLAASVEAAREVGAPLLSVWPLAAQAALGLQTGEWPAALERASRGVSLSRRSLQHGVLPLPLAYAGTLRWLLGEYEAGWDDLREAEALTARDSATDQHLRWLALSSRAFLHLIGGEPEPAFQIARRLADRIEERRGTSLFLLHRAGLPTLIESALDLGDVSTARTAHDRLASLAGALGHRPGLAQAARLQGRFEGLAGRLAPAEAAFAEAIAEWRALGQPYEQARTLRDLGRVRQDLGDREVALGAYREALDLFDRLGAVRDADLVRSALRTLGVRPTRRRATTGAHGLTDRELEIVRLIVNRKTNREIADVLVISPLTVETHVHNILRKLDLPSRTLIQTWAAERDLLP